MKVTIEIGKSITPRGKAHPVEMVYVETDDPQPNILVAIKATLSGYVMLANRFIEEHPKDCLECPAYVLHKKVHGAVVEITGMTAGFLHVGK